MNILDSLPTPTEPAPAKPRQVNAWGLMKIGDWFDAESVSIRVEARRAGAAYGRKFKVNQIPGGYRVTRVR